MTPTAAEPAARPAARPGRSREELSALATEASARLEGRPAEEIVAWAAAEFGDRF